MDTEVEGVDTMQAYLKQKMAMTGYHQENENLSAVNVNCSGGSSDWTCISGQENVEKAFELIE